MRSVVRNPFARTVRGIALLAGLWMTSLGANVALSAEAAEPASPPEDLFREFILTDNVFPQGAGNLQIALRTLTETDNDDTQIEVPLSLDYGVTDRFDVALTVPFVALALDEENDERGIGDLEFGASYAIRQDFDSLAITGGVGISVPTGSDHRGLGAGEVVVEPSVVLGRQLGSNQLHANVGASLAESDYAFVYGLGTVFPIARDWRLTAESTGEIGGENDVRVGTGILWHPNDRTELGFGLFAGVTPDAPEWGAIFHFVYE